MTSYKRAYCHGNRPNQQVASPSGLNSSHLLEGKCSHLHLQHPCSISRFTRVRYLKVFKRIQAYAFCSRVNDGNDHFKYRFVDRPVRRTEFCNYSRVDSLKRVSLFAFNLTDSSGRDMV